MMAEKASQLKPRTVGSGQPSVIGWNDDYADKTKGLRVWVYGFACTNSQSTPIVEKIGEKITGYASFLAAMTAASNIIPTGGTCPSAAFERSLGMIMANDLLIRPFKAALLFTDGVFYDQPKPEISSKGFPALGVLTYALGIAIPDNGDNNGLTPAEIKDQNKQLLGFVNGEADRFLNFDQAGYNALNEISTAFVDRLPSDAEANLPRLTRKPYFCGFTSSERCLNTNPDTFDTSKYCKWIPNDWNNFGGAGRCMDKDWCSWTVKSQCNVDSNCRWLGGTCYYTGSPLV